MPNLTKTQAMRQKVSALEVENWNLKHPAGTKVYLHKDDGSAITTSTRSEAFVSASGHAVCCFVGVSGFYLLSRAQAIAKAEGEASR